MTKSEWYKKNKKRVLARQRELWKDPKVRARHYALIKVRKNKLKDDLLEHAGGKCLHCGYNKYKGALDFHHIGRKRFKVADAPSRKEAFKEIKNCILLCCRCHRELHAGFGRN
jgi:5-methylcytosine-specific restriction endonuclease McrA